MLPIPTGLRVPAACGRYVFGAAPLVLPTLIFGTPRSHLCANARRPPAPPRSQRFCRPTTGRTRAYGYPRQNYSENDPHIQAQARVLGRVVNAGGSVHDLVEANSRLRDGPVRRRISTPAPAT